MLPPCAFPQWEELPHAAITQHVLHTREVAQSYSFCACIQQIPAVLSAC